MLPSIFYKDMEDGSILGALPSALLADNKVVHRQGCASLQDHFRTRLMNSALVHKHDHNTCSARLERNSKQYRNGEAMEWLDVIICYV